MSDEFGRGATTMEVNGLTCTLHMPAALKSKRGSDGSELTHGLPPGNARAAFRVGEYDEACPESWIRGSAEEASYFVPVEAEHGLWLDFNGNLNHSHHVAVLISVQGVNPITGRPVGDDKLEQYRKNCPVHNVKFGEERFCKACGFKWDAQNYLAGNATPYPFFWLDGFRAKDGEVRQYVFTEDVARGVAAQIVGEERVFAIGVAFYLSKEEKPPAPPSRAYRGYGDQNTLIGASFDHHDTPFIGYVGSSGRRAKVSLRAARVRSTGSFGSQVGSSVEDSADDYLRNSGPALEIAAGAKINQRIYQDPEKLDFWQDEPAGRLYINYCSVEVARSIIAAGKKDLTAGGEGFMEKLKVGQD